MDRLTAGDLNMLWPDDAGWPQDIGVLALLDATDLSRTGGGPDVVSVLRHAIEGRPLDRDRPLWAMWLLSGLAEGRVGCYVRVHHAVADGASGIAILAALFDTVPHANVVDVPSFSPQAPPSTWDLFRDNLGRRLRGAGKLLAALVRPLRTLRRMRAGWPAVRETMASGRTSRTSLNVPIGPARVFALVRGHLGGVLAGAHRSAATANDVLLSAVAGGLRDLLQRRGERVDGGVLRAYVPVSLHQEASGLARGNLTGMMATSLPVDVCDPVKRLDQIAAETAVGRKRSRPPASALLRNGVVQRALLPLMGRQRWANVYVANVPGPRAPLYLAGARVLEQFPILPLLGNITLAVGALSYDGQFNLTAVGDRDACGDIGVFVAGVEAALRTLTLEPAVAASIAGWERGV
jgi:WS/DGAT/MGAT family acyltransferase